MTGVIAVGHRIGVVAGVLIRGRSCIAIGHAARQFHLYPDTIERLKARSKLTD